jgi:hypothetical protein
MPLRPTLFLLALALSGCATAGYTPDRVAQMPADRQGLAPQYRFFYDALIDDGDWVLIEPYGYVFRPDVNFVAWRPYIEGFWAPTDIYGWVWVSSEPFGWATYHYGQWAYDRFQGWVWLPGLEWGPAWVAWRESNDYVGWAPLMPRGSDFGNVPGGAFVFVPTLQLPSTSVATGVLSIDQLGDAAASIEPVANFVERDGVMFNRGPSIDRIERITGLLPRGALSDLIPAGRRVSGGALRERGSEPQGSDDDLVRLTRRAAAEAARDAGSLVEAKARAPIRIPVVRPVGRGVGAPAPAPAPVPAEKRPLAPSRKAAAPDSTRQVPDPR